ncbi:cysteine hydrolase [archaeon]|nr:cysteine hydrolase [archaeon]
MKSAVIVVDMITGMEKWIPRKRIEKIMPNIKNLLEKARKEKVPVIFAVHRPLGKKGTRIYSEIAAGKNDTILGKNEYSCFYNTDMDKILKKLKVKQLIVAGVSTHWCVLTTAIDASYRKYKTVLLEDCITAPDNRKHKLAIEWMKDTLPVVVKDSKQKLW